MPFKIIASQCTSSSACEPLCPNVAMSVKAGNFVIESKKCTECIVHFDEPQCVPLCRVENTNVIDTSVPRYQAPA
ncbi:ferredoxin [Bradyrhizobium sp. 164]|uniref:ferredoxin n=1 Tax=Bradyrhizobium sp. 164 TaxID=2782637 RepID=UPI001FF93034|nr:ferredoxin [Bradyrhizobium sp. 164]MCK1593408.1 ferredoxin [Bradyrhizobium sp. 164]